MNYLADAKVAHTEDGTPYISGERSEREQAAIKEARSHVMPSGEGIGGFGRCFSEFDLNYIIQAAKVILDDKDDQD